jgi:hypothetical protein
MIVSVGSMQLAVLLLLMEVKTPSLVKGRWHCSLKRNNDGRV